MRLDKTKNSTINESITEIIILYSLSISVTLHAIKMKD